MQQFSALPLYALIFFLAILVFLELGLRLGRRHLRRDPGGMKSGLGAVEAAVFGLMGLLIAFTFSGAAQRMSERHNLIVEESNAIGTAWLRLDLLPVERQPELRRLLRAYVDHRIAFYRDLLDPQARTRLIEQAAALQREIWSRSVAAVQEMPSPPLGANVLQALNTMIDITTTRFVALRTHPPLVIYLMLCALTLISALFIGYGMAGATRRHWLHSIGYAVVMTTSLYAIIDFEFPRLGTIRVDRFDQILLEQRESMD